MELNQSEAEAVFELAKTFTVDRLTTAEMKAKSEAPEVNVSTPVTEISTPVTPAYIEPLVPSPWVPVSTVPVTPPAYTMDQLAVAATQLVDAGRREALVGLINTFGVSALTALAPEHYGAFATHLRTMGAKI